MILCVGTTPATQRIMVFPRLVLDAVNRAATTQEGPAGKAVNVAKVLQVLGEHPLAIGFVGGEGGERLVALLKAQGVQVDFLTVTAPTRLCVTVMDETAGTVTELVEESQTVAAEDYEKLRALIRQWIPHCRAVVMSGTITPRGPEDFYRELTRVARRVGAISVADAKGAALREVLPARPDLVKPNRSELEMTVGRKLNDEAEVKSAMRTLVEEGAERVVVTAGRGPTLAFDGRTFWRISPPLVKTINPIGSGDAFTAGLVWRLLRGDELGEACRWGTACGAANALTYMAGEVHRQDVDRLVRDVKEEQL